MDNYKYIGVIKYQNQWRIFGDNRNRIQWGIRLDTLDYIPESRKNSINILQSNIEQYMMALTSEIVPKQHFSLIQQPWITFVVNFDEKVFIDNGGDDAYFLPIDTLIPPEWRYLMNNPLFYIPQAISNLWLGKSNNDKNVLISPQSTICGICYGRQWQFYFGHREMWILDFAAFMEASNQSNWLSDSAFGDFRKNLPSVSDTNADVFISELAGYELTHDEISILQYNLLEDDKFQLEYLKDSLKEIVDVGEQANRELLIAMWTRPHLYSIIDFDTHVVIESNGSSKYPLSQVKPSDLFAPPYWTAYIGDPVTYLPKNLQTFWQ